MQGEGSFALRDPLSAPVAPSVALEVLASVRASEPSSDTDGPVGPGFELLPKGSRHENLVQLVGLLRRQGWGEAMLGKLLVGINASLVEGEPLPMEELRGIITSTTSWAESPPQEFILETEEEGEEDIFLASEMTMPPPLPWLWHPWLPEGRLVLLVGDEGIGKGMFSAFCAVRMVEGTFGPQAPVMWFSIEDDPKEDIYKRLVAAGYNPDHHADVHFLNPDKPIGFPTHIPTIEKYIERTGIKLVIIDPGRSYLVAPEGAELNFNSDVAMRFGLQAINRMAARTGATVLFIHHTNKNADATQRAKSGGSVAFSQAARHRVDVAKAGSGDLAEWALEVTKTNYGMTGHLTEYRLTAAPEYDTAFFEIGEPLRGHPSIGSWQKGRSKELDNPSIDLADSDKLAIALDANVVRGTTIPSRDELAILARIPRQRIPAAIEELIQEGRIEPDGDSTRRKWVG